MSEIILSVVIPVYNTERYIKKCLDSVLYSNSDIIEVVIVNDGTKDNSITLVEREFDDKRIRIINKCNGGLSSARNRGISEAKGKYILSLDSDDYLDRNAVDIILCEILNNDLDVIVFDVNVFNGSRVIKRWSDCDFNENEVISGSDYLKQFLSNKGIPSCWNKVFKRELYTKFNITHPENISYGEDGSTVPRLMANAHKVGKINEFLYYYVQRENSMMNNANLGKKIREYSIAFDMVDNYLLLKTPKVYSENKVFFAIWYKYYLLKDHTYENAKKDNKLCTLYEEYINFIKTERIPLAFIFKFNTFKEKIFFLILYVSKFNLNFGEFVKLVAIKLK